MFKSRIVNFINNGETDNSKLLRSIIVFFSSILLLVFTSYFLYEIVLLTNSSFSLSIELMLDSLYSVWGYIYGNILPNYLLMISLLSTVIIWVISKEKIEESPRIINKSSLHGVVLAFSCFLLLFYSFLNFMELVSQGNINFHFYNFLSYILSAFFLYSGLFIFYLSISLNISDVNYLFKKDIKNIKILKYLSIIYFIFIALSVYYQYFWIVSIIALVFLHIICFLMLADNNTYSTLYVSIMEKRGFKFSKNSMEGKKAGQLYCVSYSEFNLFYKNGLSVKPLSYLEFKEKIKDTIDKHNIDKDEIIILYFSYTKKEIHIFNLDNELLKVINY